MSLRVVLVLTGGLGFFAVGANAQSVLFDFDSLPPHSGLPGAYTDQPRVTPRLGLPLSFFHLNARA